MPTNSVSPGFGYPSHHEPLYRAVPLEGVPQIPADIDWDIRRGFEPTPEQERRASAAIAAACLEIQRRDVAEKAGPRPPVRPIQTREELERKAAHQRQRQRQRSLSDYDAEQQGEEAAA